MANKYKMADLLQKCKKKKIRSRCNPAKVLSLITLLTTRFVTNYMENLFPFTYLVIPFKFGGYTSTLVLVTANINKMVATFSQLSIVNINPKSFGLFLAIRLLTQLFEFN